MSKLLTPLLYLRVTHSEKSRYDWWWPVVLTALATLALSLFSGPKTLLGNAGVLHHSLDFLRLMTGFYVASLGVVASLQNAAMDKPMEHSPKLGKRELTRRRFLCLLFGYLSFLSLLSYMIGSVIDVSSDYLVRQAALYLPLMLGLSVIVLLPFFQIVCITTLGLHYLSERMFRPELLDPDHLDDE